MRRVTGSFPTWSERMALADLWTVTLVTGTVLRWTSADVPITANGQTYLVGPIMQRGPTRLTSTLEVDTLDVTVMTGGGISLQGIPLAHAAANGALDGASVRLERAFMPEWGQVAATVHLFEGRVSAVDPRHTEVEIQVKSLLETLDSNWPRNLYQPACNHQLYGQGCGLQRGALQATGSATGGTSTRVDFATGKATGYYDQGVVVFTSGRNLGARRTIKESTAQNVTVALPLPFPVLAGEQFTIVPGCDKTHATCRGKFNNLGAFRGFPWVPRPEMAR